MSNFNEAFENITKSRHYEPPPSYSNLPTTTTRTTTNAAAAAASSVIIGPRNPKAIVANPRQRGNPILKYVRSVPLEFSSDVNMAPDYVVSSSVVLLYLSVKYHKLNPEYLFTRMEALKRVAKLRVVLVQVDDVDCEGTLLRIQALCVANGFTTICAFSEEEAARYLELYKQNEKKNADDIEGKQNSADYLSRATDALTKVRGVNKSDVKNLLRNFGSVGDILGASMEDFALCAGIGEKKVARMHAAFNEPFFAPNTSAPPTTGSSSRPSPEHVGPTTTTANTTGIGLVPPRVLQQHISMDIVVLDDDDGDVDEDD